jgi:hypothetical protein
MSLARAEPAPIEAAKAADELPAGIGSRGVALSAALHVVLGGVLILGLPKLFDPPPVEEMPIDNRLDLPRSDCLAPTASLRLAPCCRGSA